VSLYEHSQIMPFKNPHVITAKSPLNKNIAIMCSSHAQDSARAISVVILLSEEPYLFCFDLWPVSVPEFIQSSSLAIGLDLLSYYRDASWGFALSS
jgi:hypothetical protein